MYSKRSLYNCIGWYDFIPLVPNLSPVQVHNFLRTGADLKKIKKNVKENKKYLITLTVIKILIVYP